MLILAWAVPGHVPFQLATGNVRQEWFGRRAYDPARWWKATVAGRGRPLKAAQVKADARAWVPPSPNSDTPLDYEAFARHGRDAWPRRRGGG